jgi:tetratricopeptide (TPR) repeat protein
MRTALLVCIGAIALPAAAQVDQQRAQEFFKEAQALCERDGGRLWGVSICAPMVIGDARTQTFATSQPPPDAPRPKIIGLLNWPVQWGDTMWAALSWDTIANWPPRTRGEAFLHESFHVFQQWLGLVGGGIECEHLDAVDGRYWLRLEWRALARALRNSGEPRALAVRDALAFRQARHTRYPDQVENEHYNEIGEGLASYTQTVLAARSEGEAIARALELLAGAEDGESFVRTFAYTSGPAYGVLLDAASPGWPRRIRTSDDPAVVLMRALGVQPATDAAAAAARYGGAKLRAAEEQREQQRQARIAELRQRFVDGPVLVISGGGGGYSDSRGAVVIPGVGTVYFGAYRLNGEWGTLEADKGVLLTSDGRTRRLPAPLRRDDTISGDGWTFKAASGWVIREGARRGDYEVVRQSPRPALEAGQPGAQSVQYRSPEGVEYHSLPDTDAVKSARAALEAEPRNIARIIDLGVAQSGARQFREAIATFTRGLEIEPDNALLLRWRGHRYLSVREFDRAFADLTRGAAIDGTIYGIWYHLGVVQYLRGDFAEAAASFARAQPIAPDAGELAGSTDWLWMSLSRAGRGAEAKAMLDRRPDSKPVTNAYTRRLQLYRGEIGPEAVLTAADTDDVQVATLAYGLGNWYLVQGDTTQARKAFERSVQSGGWPGFGFIVSEVELRRLR